MQNRTCSPGSTRGTAAHRRPRCERPCHTPWKTNRAHRTRWHLRIMHRPSHHSTHSSKRGVVMCEVVDVSARARAQLHQSERLCHAKGGVVDARVRAQLHQSERLCHTHAKDLLSGTVMHKDREFNGDWVDGVHDCVLDGACMWRMKSNDTSPCWPETRVHFQGMRGSCSHSVMHTDVVHSWLWASPRTFEHTIMQSCVV
jgi:hypothetical protein